MQYRPEIDGLRAIAVISVIFYHAGFKLFSGGYIGVDVFFVISGYLITTIIHNEIQDNTFSIANFYERRVRRILPALFFVILACIPLAWLWLLPGEYKDFSLSIVAVSLFSSNILFWMESGYFSPAADLKPLLHTWSLGVEEQFYVFFPLLLLLLRKFRDSILLIILTVIIIMSLSLSEYSSRNYPIANFYLLVTRAWELGIGSILAISAQYWKASGGGAQILSSVGMGMIVYSVFFFDETVPIPSSYALIPVFGAALIIAYANRDTVVGSILGWKLFVGIGLVSYSAYLWHHPLFAFARLRSPEEPSPKTFLILISCSLILAYLTFRFIETPFRNKKKYSQGKIFFSAITISIAFIIFGLIGYLNDGFDSRLSERQNELLAYLGYDRVEVYREGTCFLEPDQKYYDFKDECYSSAFGENSTVIWGDSHAAALSYGFRENIDNVTQLTASLCAPLIGYYIASRPNCKGINKHVLEKLVQLRPGLLILHANWIAILKNINNSFDEALTSTISYVNSISPETKIIVVGGVPQWRPSLPELLFKSGIELSDEALVHSQTYKGIQKTDSLLRDISNKKNATFISILDIFCMNKKCLSSVKMENTYEPFAWDYGHLTKYSSSLVSKKVLLNIGVDGINK